jgi:polysaccharide deacetylase family protein (PEP-CTERM system associated)
MTPTYLFSIDLEDIRLLIENGERFKDAVPRTTNAYLDFLRVKQSKCTFFVVGDVARRHPELIRKIIEEGHEIGCHTDKHVPLNLQTPESFQKDLELNLESLTKAGAKDIIGFRAPIFSLTKNTAWAYEVLSKLGFKYSSSVLPADNPLYGWKEFGTQVKVIDGIVEVPMTRSNLPLLKVPFGGGLYFRVLPKIVLNQLFCAATKHGVPIGGYMHPYDIDLEQEKFMQPGINNNPLYNFLMYYGRGSVFPKLEMVMDMGVKIRPYKEYLKL